MSHQETKQKVVAVTGAASGIGAALAVKAASEGYRLALSDWNEKGLAELDIPDAEIHRTHLDVSKRDDVFAWVQSIQDHYGRIDMVVNNAGVSLAQTVADTSPEDFEWLMGINFWGVVYGSQAVLPMMRQQGSGSIVNISSLFGIIGVPTQAAYCASKFAVRGFTESLRQELVHQGITVTSVHPGGVKTNIVRNGRFYQDHTGGRDKDRMSRNFERLAKTTSEQAADIIWRAAIKGKPRVLVGPDARFLEKIARVFPGSYERFMKSLMRKAGKR